MPANLVEIGLLVAYELHHAGQVLVLVVAAEELELAVAADEHERRTILAHPVDGGILVDGDLQGREALHLAHVIVGDGLSAERHIHHHVVGIGVVGPEPRLVQAQQHGNIAAGGMARDDNLAGVAAIFGDVPEHPGHGLGRVVERLTNGDLGQQAVVDAHHHEPFFLQLLRNLLVARLKAAAVEPYHHGTVADVCGMIHVELQPLLGIGVGLAGVADVANLNVGL